MKLLLLMPERYDQFYTKEPIAKDCLTRLYHILSDDLKLDLNTIQFIEPSAGTGNFYKNLPQNSIGLDIDPKYDGIIRQNFYDFVPEPNNNIICIVGNPPFGINCKDAVKFFNHASSFSTFIAFIIPRTFKRTSIQNRLSLNFKLIYSNDLPLIPCCFSPSMNAKCCFQIYEKTSVPRMLLKMPKIHTDFEFINYGQKDNNNQPTVPSRNLFDFAIKAYGGSCGKIRLDAFEELRPKSWHFIKDNTGDVNKLIDVLNSLDYSISKDSVRQDSLGRGDLIHLYSIWKKMHE